MISPGWKPPKFRCFTTTQLRYQGTDHAQRLDASGSIGGPNQGERVVVCRGEPKNHHGFSMV